MRSVCGRVVVEYAQRTLLVREWRILCDESLGIRGVVVRLGSSNGFWRKATGDFMLYGGRYCVAERLLEEHENCPANRIFDRFGFEASLSINSLWNCFRKVPLLRHRVLPVGRHRGGVQYLLVRSGSRGFLNSSTHFR